MWFLMKRYTTAARLQHVRTVAHIHSSDSVTHMCVIILWRKTPSTKSMNIESLSSELDPRGPKVLTCKKKKKVVSSHMQLVFQVFYRIHAQLHNKSTKLSVSEQHCRVILDICKEKLCLCKE